MIIHADGGQTPPAPPPPPPADIFDFDYAGEEDDGIEEGLEEEALHAQSMADAEEEALHVMFMAEAEEQAAHAAFDA
jgi:hypothetical protein